jgi:polysaccharide biosynthesis/export protein
VPALPRRSRLAASAAALAALLLGACQPGADLPSLPPPASVAYTLGPGDAVRVITFGEPTLTGQFTVGDGGAVAVPLLDSVPAAGLTTEALAAAISFRLREKNLLRNPSVSVEVVGYRPIFVLGEVSRPGQYPYQPGMTLLSAVAVAGGFTYRAVEDTASVVRSDHGTPREWRADRAALLQPGDVVTIFERHF